MNNPAYAGAFVYGRKRADPGEPPGSAKKARRPMEEWIAVHKDVYPAYVSWERLMAVRDRLEQNRYRFEQSIQSVSKGAPRSGRALLGGIVFCGACGQRMRVYYREKEGVRYVCDRTRSVYGGAACGYLQGNIADEAVAGAFFEAVEPSEIALLEEVLKARDADRERVARHHRDRVKGAEYEAHLAEKRHRSVDPENRLVAQELERSWESALRALAEARQAAERFERERRSKDSSLAPALREQLLDLGGRLPELWESESLGQAHKKELLRSLVERVILSHQSPETLEVRIVWVSGAVSTLALEQTVTHEADLSNHDQLVKRTLALAKEGYSDRVAARVLTEEGFRSARNTSGIEKGFVQRVRLKHGVHSLSHRSQGTGKFDGKWTISGLSRELGIDSNWLYRWMRSGELPAERSPKTGHYLIEDTPVLMTKLRAKIKEKGLV